MICQGKVWRYGDNVDTDVIIPARYLNTADPKELAQHCMEDIDSTFVTNVAVGDIVVADKNFGCGSSREHAPVALKASGISCVVAGSFARIFYRNAINIGLPLVELGDDVKKIKEGHVIRIDLETGILENTSTQEIFKIKPLPGFIRDIAQAGGLINYVKGEKS